VLCVCDLVSCFLSLLSTHIKLFHRVNYLSIQLLSTSCLKCNKCMYACMVGAILGESVWPIFPSSCLYSSDRIL